jgi:hypothetical protein
LSHKRSHQALEWHSEDNSTYETQQNPSSRPKHHKRRVSDRSQTIDYAQHSEKLFRQKLLVKSYQSSGERRTIHFFEGLACRLRVHSLFTLQTLVTRSTKTI